MRIPKAGSLAMGIAMSVLFAQAAQANTITGNLYRVPEAVVNSPTGATPANVPAGIPDVIFDVNTPLTFNATGATIGAFLATGGAFNIIQNTPGALAAAMDNGTTGTLINFVGFVTVTNGQLFTVSHDDGLTLTVGGLLVVNVPGPTAPALTVVTYTGPTGTFPFQLVYTECCGGPAVLEISLPLSSVPEPTTLSLVALGIAGLTRRLARKAS